MKDNPLISVIVPVYNVEKYLRKCLDSIINQTYTNLEILVVDDGSTDSSGNICDEYAEKDTRIKVFHKENGGLSSARNYALEHVTGEYLHYVDSDDWLDTDLYRRCAEEFIKDSTLELIGFEIMVVDYSKESYSLSFISSKVIRSLGESNLFNYYIENYTSPNVWNKIYRFNLIKDLRFVEGLNYEDVEYTFWSLWRVHNYKVLSNKYCGYYYRINLNSITSSSKSVRDLLINVVGIYNKCRKKNVDLVPFAGYLAYTRLSYFINHTSYKMALKELKYIKEIIDMDTIDKRLIVTVQRYISSIFTRLYLLTKYIRKYIIDLKVYIYKKMYKSN